LPLRDSKDAVATLEQLAQDDSLLRQLDVEGEAAYPLTAERLQQLDAYIVASHLQLARRSALLEKSLEGEDYVKLAVDPKALADNLAKVPQINGVRLWTQPLVAILDQHTIPQESRQLAAAEFAPLAEQPLIWKARLLHFQGDKGVRAEDRNDPLAEQRAGHAEAIELYRSPEVRPSNADLARLEEATRTIRTAGKAAAGYWLGLLSYDRGNHEVALHWLGERTLEEARASKWAHGARYNLARTHEALGNFEEALRLLRSDPKDAPQRHGNLLRAKRLEAQAAKAAKKEQAVAQSPAP
jgi:tetratricopeptide (TPR) repeat protein